MFINPQYHVMWLITGFIPALPRPISPAKEERLPVRERPGSARRCFSWNMDVGPRDVQDICEKHTRFLIIIDWSATIGLLCKKKHVGCTTNLVIFFISVTFPSQIHFAATIAATIVSQTKDCAAHKGQRPLLAGHRPS